MLSSACTHSALATAQAARAWSPANLPGLLAWFDFSQRTTVTVSGGFVDAVQSRVGSYALQDVSNDMVHAPGLLNGRDGVTAVNGGGFSVTPNIVKPSAGFVYVLAANDDAVEGCIHVCTGNSGVYALGVEASGALNNAGQVSPVVIGAQASDGLPHIISTRHNGTASVAAWDDLEGAEYTAPAFNISHFAAFGFGYNLDGALFEIIVGAGSLTDDEHEKIKAYLRNKWGLS